MSDIAHNAPSVAESAPTEQPMKSTDTGLFKKEVEAPAPKPAKAAPAQKAEPVQATEQADEVETEREESDATSADASREKRKERLPRWVQERMARAELVAERRAEERVRREYEQRTQAPQQPAPVNVTDPGGERQKTLADFNFDQDAFLEYKVEQGIQRREAQAQQREAERAQHEAQEQFKTRIDSFETRVGAGAWDDIVHSPINTDPALKSLTDLFMGDDNDLDIALHLANDPAEAYRINALPPLQRAREVAKLGELFAGGDEPAERAPPRAATPPPPPKKTTNAPPPVKTVSGGGKPSVNLDSPDISPEARIAAWRKQGIVR